MTIGDTFRHLGWPSADDPRPDAELVGRFVQHRDEPAFAELLRRHGPTVYGVCRRIVGHTHDADDAFQAVFLVLARKADTIRPPGMVGNWLYGVAVRTANKARVMNAKRRIRELASREREGPESSTPPVPHAPGSPDTLEVIDSELAALPDVYRAAFVACDLNGRSRSQAAKDLGWPEGTLAARLAKARDLLAKRLTKRGVTLSAATLTTVSVPSALAAETLNAVRELVAVGAANAVAPAAQQLSDQMVNSMNGAIWKPAAILTLFIGLTVGTTALVYAAGGEKPGPRSERKPLTNAPIPKDTQPVWTEQPSIELEGGGRITSIAYAPSGKMFAVCRDNGMLDFYNAATRKHSTSMRLGGDPKSNPNTEVGTITSIAFRPTPHAKMGEVFAVTHKNGVKIGATDLGLMADNGAAVNDIPPNWLMEDPHQVTWVKNGDGVYHVVATNGMQTHYHLANGTVGNWPGWNLRHKLSVLSTDQDGKRLLLRFWDKPQELTPDNFDVQLVTLDGKDPKQTLSGHKSRPICGAASKDGKLIVTGDEGGTLIVWDGETFKEKTRIEQGPGLATLALSPDGKTLAVLRTHGVDLLGGPANRMGTAFELFTFNPTDAPAKPAPIWKTEKLLPGKLTGPVSLAFSPDGSTLLAAFGDPYPGVDAKLYGDDMQPQKAGVHVWTVGDKRKKNAPVPKTGKEWHEDSSIELKDAGRVTGVAHSADGKSIAIAQDGKLSVLNATTLERRFGIEYAEKGTITAVAFSPKGDRIAVTRKDAVDINDAMTGRGIESWELNGFDPHQLIWMFDDDGSTRITASNGEELRYRRVGAQGLPIEGAGMKAWAEQRHQPMLLAAIPGQDAMLCRFNNSQLTNDDDHDLWRIEPLGDSSNQEKWKRISGHKVRPTCAAVSKDGKLAVTGDVKGTLIVWDAEKFEEKRRIELGEGVVQLTLSPDGKTVAVLRAFQDTKLLGTSGKTLTTLHLHVFDATDPPAKPTPLWTTGDKRILGDGLHTGPMSLSFNPDGTKLLAAFGDPDSEANNPKERGGVAKSSGVRVWTLGEPRKKNAPAAKGKDDGLIWTWQAESKGLIAFTPNGDKVETPKLAGFVTADDIPLGIVHDGQKFAFARKPTGGTGLTLHLCDLTSGMVSDSGIHMDFAAKWPVEMKAAVGHGLMGWVAAGRFAVMSDREQEKPGAPLRYTRIDLVTLTLTAFELPYEHVVADISPDGERLLTMATEPRSGTQRFYLAAVNGDGPKQIAGQDHLVVNLGKFAPDATHVLCRGAVQTDGKWGSGTFTLSLSDGTITVVPQESGGRPPLIHDKIICWSPDGRRLACEWVSSGYGDPYGGIRVCDPDGKNPSQSKAFRTSANVGKLLGWFPTPGKNTPVPKGNKEWKEDAAIELKDNGRITSVAYSPDGKTIVVGQDGKVTAINTETQKAAWSHEVDAKEAATITAVAFEPGGKHIVYTAKGGVRFLTSDGTVVATKNTPLFHQDVDSHEVLFTGSTAEKGRLMMSDGVSSYWFEVSKGIHARGAWNVNAASVFDGWERNKHRPTLLAAVPWRNAALIRLNTEDANVSETDLFVADLNDDKQGGIPVPTNWKQWGRLSGHKARPTCGAVSKDGKRIVTADQNGTLIVWDGETFQEKSRADLFGEVAQLAFSPDGKTVAAVRRVPVSFDAPGAEFTKFDLHLLDVTDAQPSAKSIWNTQVKGRLNGPVSLTFSPDGTKLLAAFGDPTPEANNPKERGGVPKSLGLRVWTYGEPPKNTPLLNGK